MPRSRHLTERSDDDGTRGRRFGKPRTIEEVPIPTPGRGEVPIKIVATGVCHIDLHATNGDWPVKLMPSFIPGHEGAGGVVALELRVTRLEEVMRSSRRSVRWKRLRAKLDVMLARERRTATAQACFEFLPTRAVLDLEDWPELDIFAH